MMGLLPGEVSVRHMYEIPSIGYSAQLPGAFYNFIGGPGTDGLATRSRGVETEYRPEAVLGIRSEAYFRLSAGDTFGLTLDRGVPAPGASVLLLAAAAVVGPRRRR